MATLRQTWGRSMDIRAGLIISSTDYEDSNLVETPCQVLLWTSHLISNLRDFTVCIIICLCNKWLPQQQELSKCLLLSESKPLWNFFPYTSTLGNYLEDSCYDSLLFHQTTSSTVFLVLMVCKNAKVISCLLTTSQLSRDWS